MAAIAPELKPEQAAVQIRKLAGPNDRDRPRTAYHAIGTLIHRVCGGYGTNKHANLAGTLKAAGVTGMGDSNLRKADKFARRFTPEQAASLDTAGVKWRVADRLMSKNLTPQKQQQLLDAVLTGQQDPAKLGDTITARSGVKARRGTRSVHAAIERAEVEIDYLIGVARGRGVEEELQIAAAKALRRISRDIAEKLP